MRDLLLQARGIASSRARGEAMIAIDRAIRICRYGDCRNGLLSVGAIVEHGQRNGVGWWRRQYA